MVQKNIDYIKITEPLKYSMLIGLIGLSLMSKFGHKNVTNTPTSDLNKPLKSLSGRFKILLASPWLPGYLPWWFWTFGDSRKKQRMPKYKGVLDFSQGWESAYRSWKLCIEADRLPIGAEKLSIADEELHIGAEKVHTWFEIDLLICAAIIHFFSSNMQLLSSHCTFSAPLLHKFRYRYVFVKNHVKLSTTLMGNS